MVNRPRAKGTKAESAVVDFLNQHGWPHAERRALAGGLDQGDIAGCIGLVWEVKHAGSGIRMAEWMSETREEVQNARADHGILVIKPAGNGYTRVGTWLAVLIESDALQLTDKASENQFTVLCDIPRSYRAENVLTEMAALSKLEPGVRSATTLLRVPNGKRDDLNAWYRIMNLHTVTTWLRKAGYGEPVS